MTGDNFDLGYNFQALLLILLGCVKERNLGLLDSRCPKVVRINQKNPKIGSEDL